MNKNSTKILLLADLHYTVVDPEMQKGQIETGLRGIVERIIDRWKIKNKKTIMGALKRARDLGPYRKVIVLGDAIECEYNERGMIMDHDLEVIARLKKKLEFIFSSTEIIYVAGDHEMGYVLPLSIDPKGGISQKSLENFQKTLGPLFEYFKIGKHIFVVFNSSLSDQDFSHRPEEEINYMKKMKSDQEIFLLDILKNTNQEEKIFVFLHNPDSLLVLNKIIPENSAKKISAVFCGHLHTKKALAIYKWLGYISHTFLGKIIGRHSRGRKMMDWASENHTRLEIFKKYNLQVVPAPGGLMGIGKGFIILEIGDSNYKIQEILL